MADLVAGCPTARSSDGRDGGDLHLRHVLERLPVAVADAPNAGQQDAAGRARGAAELLQLRLPVGRGRRDDDGRADPDLLRRSPAAVRARPHGGRQGLMPQPSGASASTVSGASAAAASETRSTTIASAPILAAFQGERPSHAILDAVAAGAPGVTLYRALNVRSASQLRDLTDELHGVAIRARLPPPIIAIDQEGGQLNAVGDGTQFPGNLALAATGSEQLAEAVGRAIGRELATLGITVNFAPDCDVLTNRDNPTVGVRSFGDDPALAARLAAAFVRGHQSQGVSTTAKHFPGGGDRSVDSHYALPVVHATLDRLRRVELQPFRAAIEAGCRLVMPAHLALPAIDGLADRPAMVSPHILRDLLRDELGFGGVVVSDALDMGAIDQDALVDEALGALRSGVDLLLAGPGHADRADLLTSIAEGLALRDRSVGGRPPA